MLSFKPIYATKFENLETKHSFYLILQSTKLFLVKSKKFNFYVAGSYSF